MSAFILPVTIESRKILFLGLEPEMPSCNSMDPGEDVFILELPVISRSKVCAISKGKNIQSLHDDKPKDLNLTKADVRLTYDAETKTVIIGLHFTEEQEKPNCISGKNPAATLTTGLMLELAEDENEVVLELKRSFGFNGNLPVDHFLVRFDLYCGETDENVPFSALIKCFLSSRQDILLTGLDFGSEASQMIEGRFDGSGSVNPVALDIFSSLRKESQYASDGNENTAFEQFESSRLFRSIFYAPKTIKMPDGEQWRSGQLVESINCVTPTGGAFKESFNREWCQVPNLKLIHDNAQIGQELRFNIVEGNKVTQRFLTDLKSGIYASLLKNIVVSTLKNRISHPVYLRFTLLVPNIYTISEIRETKKVIRQIILEERTELSQKVKGLEISSMSESDAAFFGYMHQLPQPKGGDYYIIVDCGKGTTDFSIIQAQKDDPRIMKPIYRNGFAGAGNLISFGFMEAFFHYLQEGCAGNPNALRNIDFYRTSLSRSGQQYEKNYLADLLENWKKNFNASDTAAYIEGLWNKKDDRSDWSFWKLFREEKLEANYIVFRDFLNSVPKIYDWGGHISNAVSFIVEKVSENLIPAISHLNKTAKCGGILFTGRGFLFKPLEMALKANLASIPGIKPHMFIDNTHIDLKEICLQGIFTRNVLSYSDMATTPIEIEKGTLRRKDVIKPGLLQKVGSWFSKVAVGDETYYSEETNSGVIRSKDLSSCQFLIGGKIYQPDYTERISLKEAFIVHTRKGFFIKAITDKDKAVISGINKVGNISNGQGAVDATKKSLFPGWFDPEYIGAKASA